MEFLELDTCPVCRTKAYGGTGKKYAIDADGVMFLVKFPANAKHRDGKHRSNTAVNEYIGSQIYRLIGVPVHDVHLGIREGSVVAACRDIEPGNDRLLEFASIKNTVAGSSLLGENASCGDREFLSDVLTVIRTSFITASVKEQLEERFWSMVAVDALIGNKMRDNWSWGLLEHAGTFGVAPVYANGHAFCCDVRRPMCFFADNNGKHLNPFKLIHSENDAIARRAFNGVLEHLDVAAIDDMIADVPESYRGTTVVERAEKERYRRTLHVNAERLAKAISGA